jgi:hypothetical protein
LARRLLWIFYSAQILLFGAEFTQVYTKTYRSQVEPQEHAVKAEKKGSVPSDRESHESAPREKIVNEKGPESAPMPDPQTNGRRVQTRNS